jgi:CBS-domain-containing membrane protein
LKVADVMRRQFMSLAPEDSVRDAELTMRLARVRFLPVVRDGTLLGLVSYHRLVRDWLGGLLRRRSRSAADPGGRSVDRLMTRAPKALGLESGLDEAASRLAAETLGFLPVVDCAGGSPQLVGVVTETDLLRAAYENWTGAARPRRSHPD